MRYFFDNCLSPKFAKALHVLSEADGHEVRHLIERFDEATADVVWMETLANEGGWVVISGDSRIVRNKHERSVWLKAKLTTFFLADGWQNIKFWDQAAHLVRKWPLVLDQATRVAPGAGFLIKLKSNQFEQIRLD